MSKFIDISDTKGKHWCINTDQIIAVIDNRGTTTFVLNWNGESVTTNLTYSSALAKLQNL